jgi:hypothetical protein
MNLITNFQPDREDLGDQELFGVSIEKYCNQPEHFDDPQVIIWRVENFSGHWDNHYLVYLIERYIDPSCTQDLPTCHHDHDCCGCSFLQSFGIEAVNDTTIYIRKVIGLNY